jgi:hypothetical protein
MKREIEKRKDKEEVFGDSGRIFCWASIGAFFIQITPDRQISWLVIRLLYSLGFICLGY